MRQKKEIRKERRNGQNDQYENVGVGAVMRHIVTRNVRVTRSTSHSVRCLKVTACRTITFLLDDEAVLLYSRAYARVCRCLRILVFVIG